MTLAELQYVVAVAQERHFGRAAARVFVTQPALSLAIKKLEDDLGTTIFERRQNKVELTPPGEQIVHQTRRVLGKVCCRMPVIVFGNRSWRHVLNSVAQTQKVGKGTPSKPSDRWSSLGLGSP